MYNFGYTEQDEKMGLIVMLGKMISKIRKDKGITKVELSRRTKINIGHLTHIEKGERNPSHKALKNICTALDVPYQNLMHMYEREYTEANKRCKMLNHISYNKVVAIDNFENFIECPSKISNASMAFKIHDDSMEPKINKGDYAFLELNANLANRNYGLFLYKGEYLVRKFVVRQDKLVLRPENKNYPEIDLCENDDFIIIGRVYPR